MCHYRIVFPQGSGEFDQILINLEVAQQVSVVLVETETFRSSKYAETQMERDVTYTIDWPFEAFLLVVSDNDALQPNYRITYRFEDRNPDEVIAAMSIEERDEYLNTKTTVEESEATDSETFWFFVAGGILGAIIIIALIYCMVVVKRRNDVMVAKVEKMTAEQLAEEDYIPEEEENDDFYASQRKAAKAKKEQI